MKTVNILGEDYKVYEEDNNPVFDSCDGYTDVTSKEIHIRKFDNAVYSDSLQNMGLMHQRIIRHEVIHSFLEESGLSTNAWGTNEEIVDWMAIQFPKILKTFIELEAI